MSTPVRSASDVGREEKLARASSVLSNYQLLIRYANLNQKVCRNGSSVLRRIKADVPQTYTVYTADQVLFRESSCRLRSASGDQKLVRDGQMMGVGSEVRASEQDRRLCIKAECILEEHHPLLDLTVSFSLQEKTWRLLWFGRGASFSEPSVCILQASAHLASCDNDNLMKLQEPDSVPL